MLDYQAKCLKFKIHPGQFTQLQMGTERETLQIKVLITPKTGLENDSATLSQPKLR